MQPLRQKLQAFMAGSATVLTFPTSLSSYHRMLVHELCEGMGLPHRSEGDDADRRIVVLRPGCGWDSMEGVKLVAKEEDLKQPQESLGHDMGSQSARLGGRGEGECCEAMEQDGVTSNVLEALLGKESGAEALPGKKRKQKQRHRSAETKGDVNPFAMLDSGPPPAPTIAPPVPAPRAPSPTTRECGLCHARVPDANFQIHTIRCEREVRERAKADLAAAAADSKTARAVPVHQASKHGDKPRHVPLKTRDELLIAGAESEDVLLAQLAAGVARCQVLSCREGAGLLGLVCSHCGARFCMRHAQPELHGCGEVHRRALKKGAIISFSFWKEFVGHGCAVLFILY